MSALFTFAGLLPYFLSISKRQIYPHNLSWLGWSFITFVGALAMLAEGGKWSVVILLANTLCCIIVVVYSVYKKVGVWSTTTFDYLFFGMGVLGIVLWQTLDAPLLAIICCIVADLCFGIPTIIKVYKNPKSENYLAWLFCVIAGILSLFAVNRFVLGEFLYPLYLFIFDLSVFVLVARLYFYRK